MLGKRRRVWPQPTPRGPAAPLVWSVWGLLIKFGLFGAFYFFGDAETFPAPPVPFFFLPAAHWSLAGAAGARPESALTLLERVEEKRLPLLPASGFPSHPAKRPVHRLRVYPRVVGAGRSVAGKRSSSRERSLHGSRGASLCLFLARAALGCSASCCNVARLLLPLYLPLGSHQAPRRAAQLSAAGQRQRERPRSAEALVVFGHLSADYNGRALRRDVCPCPVPRGGVPARGQSSFKCAAAGVPAPRRGPGCPGGSAPRRRGPCTQLPAFIAVKARSSEIRGRCAPQRSPKACRSVPRETCKKRKKGGKNLCGLTSPR